MTTRAWSCSRGAGEKAFVAGADIKYMSSLSVLERARGEVSATRALLLETMRKPTIAAINGFALGGGCELALACDLRYAATTAKLGQPRSTSGSFRAGAALSVSPESARLGVAKELILTGRLVDAEEALRIGLVNGVHDPVLDRAREVAELLASKSALALAYAKEAANLALQGSHEASLTQEASFFAMLFSTEDAKEGLTAFAEKRDPVFKGR
jgi:enoyl-CoA hydratase